jgi:predicted pyridoxine 5'-phosphate oxidase superfamily flavin-nucleotide-binding protein
VQGAIASQAALEAIYSDQPAPAATAKEVTRLTPHYRALIEAAPFVVLATAGPEGLDCSPRGDRPGFVRVADSARSCCPTGAATTGSTRCATSCATRVLRCCS